MKVERKNHESGKGWFWAFSNEEGVQFFCPPGNLEKILVDSLEKSTEEFIFQE